MDEAGLCKSKSSKKIPWTEMSVRVRFPSGARGAVFKDCPILQKPDNKHFAFIRLYFMLFGFVKNCL
jgi:hypothetical protein